MTNQERFQKYIDEHVADESIDVLNAIVNYQA